MKTLNPAVARVLKRLHFPLDVILTCVRWYSPTMCSRRSNVSCGNPAGIEIEGSTRRPSHHTRRRHCG